MWLNLSWKFYHQPLHLISPEFNVFFVTSFFQSFMPSFTNIIFTKEFHTGKMKWHFFVELVDNEHGNVLI